MKKSTQIGLFLLYIAASISTVILLYLSQIISLDQILERFYLWIPFFVLYLMMINEGMTWIKNGKRSEWSDLVIIAFLFITIHLIGNNAMFSFMGAFLIYMILGITELKDYEVLNKILIMTVITYAFVFVGSIVSYILGNAVYENTAFSMSFWILLILGFAFFGRKYIVVWRFLSPEYLSMALYLIAWLLIEYITGVIKIDITGYIYEILILTNILIYFITGPLLDIMLGLKPSSDPVLKAIVEEVALRFSMDPKHIKIRFGQYPILNAMAYGAWFDMRIGIIAPSIEKIPKDELKGIIAHELAHSKGKHTLSLTLISIGELIMRKFLQWPATNYDYVFAPDKQPFPLYVFILINFVLFFFIYIFVRMFEAKADLNTKRIGYGYELAKGLYNLESFYSYGREIGLNTMLLCEEKITEDNRLLDYLDTAEYLNKMIIKPSKSALMSNFLNSHPPSYHRIIAALHPKDIGIFREAIMPITFLRQKKARQFYLETQETREKFKLLATNKVKEEFHIQNLPELYNKLEKKQMVKEEIGKTFVFLDLVTLEKIIGRLTNIIFVDDVCEPMRFEIDLLNQKSLQSLGSQIINPLLYKRIEFRINETYFLKDQGLAILNGIDLNRIVKSNNKKKKLPLTEEEKLKQGLFLFKKESSFIEKPIFDYRYPNSLQSFNQFVNNEVLFHHKSSYLLKQLKNLKYEEKSQNQIAEIEGNPKDINFKEYSIQYGPKVIPIHNEKQTWKYEYDILNYLKEKGLFVIVFLKKAVNNEEQGRIMDVTIDIKINSLKIQTIFGQLKEYQIQKIDFIQIQKTMLTFELKTEMSSLSRLITRIRAKYNPKEIIF